MIDDHFLKIWASIIVDTDFIIENSVEEVIDYKNSDPGTIVLKIPKKGFVVKCGDGYLLINEVQYQGKKRMDAPSFMRGFELPVGMRLV
jgi:methionyl-tRNA formyltransferase